MLMDKKYELITDSEGRSRPRAIKKFSIVNYGEVGGWLDGEHNLSQRGNCWVGNEARVLGKASVMGDALVVGEAIVSGEAKVYEQAKVYGKARIFDTSHVSGNAVVYGDARIGERARVDGRSSICDKAALYGDSIITDVARVSGAVVSLGTTRIGGSVYIDGSISLMDCNIQGDAFISNKSPMGLICAEVFATEHIFDVGPIGSRQDRTVFYRGARNGEPIILVNCGCFHGTIVEFVTRVKAVHRGNNHEQDYLAACKLAVSRIRMNDTKLVGISDKRRRVFYHFGGEKG